MITGDPGTPPRLAVPDFLALSNDKETQEIARTIGEVLWNDIDYEREFYMIPRDTYKSIPAADVDWRTAVRSLARARRRRPRGRHRRENRDVGARRDAALPRRVAAADLRQEYSGSAANPRLYAHTISDEIHESQRSLRGVARTKLAFSSDRNRERVTGVIDGRDVKEVFIADYDGANQRRITVNRLLNITPTWSPDGRSIGYTS